MGGTLSKAMRGTVSESIRYTVSKSIRDAEICVVMSFNMLKVTCDIPKVTSETATLNCN